MTGDLKFVLKLLILIINLIAIKPILLTDRAITSIFDKKKILLSQSRKEFFLNEKGNLCLNRRGHFVLIFLFLLVGSVVILPILMYMFEPIDIIVKIILVFSLFMTVRGFLGNGVLTIIVSGILIYFLVIKWWWIGAAGWMAITLASLGVFAVLIFTSQAAMSLLRK